MGENINLLCVCCNHFKSILINVARSLCFKFLMFDSLLVSMVVQYSFLNLFVSRSGSAVVADDPKKNVDITTEIADNHICWAEILILVETITSLF